MSSTHENLFVRRNIKNTGKVYRDVEYKYNRSIKTVAQINGNILLAGMSGKSSNNKLLDNNNAGSLRKELKPLLIMLRLLGCFPVYFSKSDVPRYRAFSPVFIYSVCLYVVVYIMTFLSARESVLHIFKKDDSISDSVFNILLIVMLVNCTILPVLAWIDTPKFVQYLHRWEQFQMMFVTVTGDRLILCTRRIANYSLISICFAPLMLVILHFLPPYLQYWQIPCYIVSYCVFCTTINTFNCIFWSLFRAATLLNNCFKRDMNQNNLSAELLGKYRILWLRWSQLVSQIGCTFGKVFCLYLVLLLFVITMVLYECLSRMNIKALNIWREITLGIVCLIDWATLFYFCNYAHHFSNIVGVEIRDELQLLAPSVIRDDTSREVKMFLETMVMYPPVVSVAGFANVDRGLFRACASTVVTYMIVLLQFDQSDRSQNACSRNVTEYVR